MTEIEVTGRVERLYRDQGRQVLGYLARRSGPDEAADLLTEVFEVVWRRRRTLPAGDEARLWIFGIARNVLLNHHRAARRRRHHEARQLADRIRQATITPTRAELDVRDALALLDPSEQEILTLAYWEGFSLVEVASLLGLPASTVRTRHRRARLRLREALQLDDPAMRAPVP